MMLLVAIFDHKSGLFSRPFTAVNESTAIRTASQSCNDPQSDYYRSPEDFVLYSFGSYDDSTGKFLLHDVPKPLTNFVKLVNAKSRDAEILGQLRLILNSNEVK